MDQELGKDKKISIDTSTLALLYQHYKAFLVPVAVIITSILLFLFFVIPQIKYYFNSRDQEKIEREKLNNLQSSLAVLRNLDEGKLNSDITTLSLALPQNKDFVGILNVVSGTAIKTGVSLGDFSFQVGDIRKNTDSSPFPSIPVSLKLAGSFQSILDYITALNQTSPLSEITLFKIDRESAQVAVNFYYKPYSGTVIDENVPLTNITPEDDSLISTISTWDSSNSFILLSTPSALTIQNEATNSAQGTNPSPF